MLHGMLVGPITPTYEERHAITAPALVIGHKIDFIHPFTDADHLTRQLQLARLVEARSVVELRLVPDRLTAQIAAFLDDIWGDGRAPGARRVGLILRRAWAAVAPEPGGQRRGAQARGLGELGHRAGEATGHHVVEGDPLEHVAEAGPDRHPNVLEVLGGSDVVGGLGPETPYLGQRAVEGPHDVGNGDPSAGRASRYPPSDPRWLATMPARRRSFRIAPRNFGGRPCSSARASAVAGPLLGQRK